MHNSGCPRTRGHRTNGRTKTRTKAKAKTKTFLVGVCGDAKLPVKYFLYTHTYRGNTDIHNAGCHIRNKVYLN